MQVHYTIARRRKNMQRFLHWWGDSLVLGHQVLKFRSSCLFLPPCVIFAFSHCHFIPLYGIISFKCFRYSINPAKETQMKRTHLARFACTVFTLCICFSGCSSVPNPPVSSSTVETAQSAGAKDLTPTASEATVIDDFDVSVSIEIVVVISDSVAIKNPDLIRAARAAVFRYDVARAMYQHYSGYAVKEEMRITEIKQTGDSAWSVEYTMDGNPVQPLDVNYDKVNGYTCSIPIHAPELPGDDVPTW